MRNEYIVWFDSGLAEESIKKELAKLKIRIKKSYPQLGSVFLVTGDINALSGPIDQFVANGNSAEITLHGSSNDLEKTKVAPWHLARLTTADLPLNSSYTNAYNGTGLTCYLIDSGVDIAREELIGTDMKLLYSVDGKDFSDPTGHGTKSASLIKGKVSGVSKDCDLKVVKVIPSSLTSTDGMFGVPLNYIFDSVHAVLVDFKKSKKSTAVVNIPWSVEYSDIVKLLIDKMYSLGLFVVCSSGNSGTSVSAILPAGSDKTLTVGASDKFDRVITTNDGKLNNNGEYVDVFAPGVEIEMPGLESSNGSSLASSIASGVALHFLEQAPDASVSSLKDSITEKSSKFKMFMEVGKFANTNNFLLATYSVTDDMFWKFDARNLSSIKRNTGIHSYAMLVDSGKYKIKSSELLYLPFFMEIKNDSVLSVDSNKIPKAGRYQFMLTGYDDAGMIRHKFYVISAYDKSEDELEMITTNFYVDETSVSATDEDQLLEIDEVGPLVGVPNK